MTITSRTLLTAATLLIGILSAASGQADPPDLERLKNADDLQGKRGFQARCSACHTLADRSSDIVGPNLWGVFDRVAGSKDGFAYSGALAEAGFRWSPQRMVGGRPDWVYGDAGRGRLPGP
ncbi:MAG: c-type cytochrome [Gammaproteobacteria bacterium]